MITKLRAAAAEESGFTLVELLIVIAILGVLAGVVVFSVAGIQDNSQTAACSAEAGTVKTAEEAYYAKNKSYATAAQLTASPNKLLGSTPTMVTIAVTAASAETSTTPAVPASYALTYVSPCTGTP